MQEHSQHSTQRTIEAIARTIAELDAHDQQQWLDERERQRTGTLLLQKLWRLELSLDPDASELRKCPRPRPKPKSSPDYCPELDDET